MSRSSLGEKFSHSDLLSLSLVVLILYLSPYLILGNRGSWWIWDNLDSNFVAYKILLESGKLFSINAEIIEQFLGGVRRGTFPSELDALVWLYWLVGAEGAYVVNRVLMTFAAFVGMYYLLSRHVVPGDQNKLIYFGVALCFATLPFWPFGGLTVAGMPLAVYALLNIRSGDQRPFNWLILILLPFYSSLVFGGVFLIATLAVKALLDCLTSEQLRKSAIRLFLGLFVMSASYALTNYRLFQDFIFLASGDFISHRKEFTYQPPTFMSAFQSSVDVFMYGQMHARSLHTVVVLPISVLSIYFLIFREEPYRLKTIYLQCFGFLIVTSLFYGFNTWSVIGALLDFFRNTIPIQVQRFHWMHPIIWMILFAVGLCLILKHLPRGSLIVIAAVSLQLLYSVRWHEYFINRASPPAYKFFAKEQFDQIARFINRPKSEFRLGSLGIHPSVALYNGFFTVDGYHSNYQLEYKHRFRKIIAVELDKKAAMKTDFDNWGSRAYLFSAELWDRGIIVSQSEIDLEIQNLNLDTNELLALGAEFLVSSVRINDQLNSSFRFLKKFEHPDSAWILYLYSIHK